MATFRVAQFNVLGRQMAGTMWYHYARDFLPEELATCPDWSREAGFPRYLSWKPSDSPPCRFYRFNVLMAEIRRLRADVFCLEALDCFPEFRDALKAEGYDAAFHPRPGKTDGCAIFWRREVFAASGPSSASTFKVPANDRIVAAQALTHRATSRKLLVVGTQLHWDQRAGHQESEAEELLRFARHAEARAGVERGAVLVCGDLSAAPGTGAYQVLRRRFRDAALREDAQEYPAGAFTSLKPDVYYFAWPKDSKHNPRAAEEWHWQQGRQEVVDYVFYDPGAFELEAPAATACLDEEPPRKRGRGSQGAETSKGSRISFWAGGLGFVGSPVPGLEERRYDHTWTPKRAQGELQLGIPNRLHGSDHLPVACTLRFRDPQSS